MVNKQKYVKCWFLGVLFYIPLEEVKDYIITPIPEEDIVELSEEELAELEGRLWIY